MNLHIFWLRLNVLYVTLHTFSNVTIEVNFRCPSYGSPWACGIWLLIVIFLIWINECKYDITWVICPGISQCWFPRYTLLLQSVSYNYLYITFCLFCAVRDSLRRPLKLVEGSRSRFTNDSLFNHLMILA